MRVVSRSWCGWVLALSLSGCSSESTRDAVATRQAGLNLSIAVVGEPFETDAAVPALGRLGHDVGVAFDGTNFAAVFEDQTRVHAVRVSPEGRALDLRWLELGSAGTQQLYPSLAFGGGAYLATWSQLAGTDPAVEGQLFSPEGTLAGESFVVASNAMYPSVAFDGTDFLVAYQLVGDIQGVAFRRVSAAGASVDGSEHSITAAGAADPVIAHAGSLGLVVWLERGDSSSSVRALRIGSDGQPLEPTPLTLAAPNGGHEHLTVAGADGKFLVAYRRDARVYGRLVDAEDVSDEVPLSPADSEAGLPAVAASGDGFVVAWADSRDELSIRGVRVSSAGAVDAPDRLLAEGKPRSLFAEPLSLAGGGDRLLVGFIGEGVQGSLFSSELEVEQGDIPLSAVPNAQGAHQVGWNGRSYVITWVDERNGRDIAGMDGRAVRIGPDGARQDPSGLVLTGPGTFSMTQAGGSDGSWLVSWYSVDDQQVHVQSVTGSTLGAPRLLTEHHLGTQPSIAFGGSSYLSAYTATILDDSPATYAVYARPIAADGTPGAEFPIELGLAQPPATYVFASGDEYVLASSLDRVTLRTVTPAGELGEPVLLQEGDAFLSAASNGDALLVASIDQETNRVAVRFFRNGAFYGNSIPIAETSSGFAPAVAWDGDTFLVVWDEDETRIPKARAVTPNGSVSAVRELSNAECYAPSLASNGDGQLLLGCVSYREHYVRRIDSYFIGSNSSPSVPPPSPAGTGGSPPNGGSAGVPAGTAGRGGNTEPSASGGTADAGQPGAGDAGESGMTPDGEGGRPSAEGGRSTSGGATGGGASAAGGSAESPTAGNDGSGGDDGGCSVGSRGREGSSAFLTALVMLAFGLRRRRS